MRLRKSEDFTLSIKIHPDFRGIMRGFAHDVSEGCILSGEVVLEIHQQTKIRSLETCFVGNVHVNFRTTNSVGFPTSDGTETNIICKKTLKNFNEKMIEDGESELIKSTTIEPGTYRFPFKFSISASLPHSLEIKHGYIRYNLYSVASRKAFSSDVRVSCPIALRRCLMNSHDPIAPPSQTVEGDMNTDIVAYSATAPSMVYCEGGLLTLGLYVALKNPEKHSVRMVTCGLEEKSLYRTTGKQSLTNQAMRYEDIAYPLGCSTFFPSNHKEYNPEDLHHYNAIFRLYPRVHPDNKATLIAVKHYLVIQMVIEDNEYLERKRNRRRESVSSISSTSSIISVGKSILSHLPFKQEHDLSKSLPNMAPISMMSNNDQIVTPPMSRSSSPDNNSPDISVTTPVGTHINSSYSSISQVVEQAETFQPDVVRVTSQKINREETDTSQEEQSNMTDSERQSDSPHHHHSSHSLTIHHHFNPLHFHRDSDFEGTRECILRIPVIVTSREEYREGSMPGLPDYETAAEAPPSYRASVQTLPPVPIYPTMPRENTM
ncbi:hypothetical protein INT48_001419 [Thamnidium elegans]|uniref:Arrestin-like N-terminal domain-containing protein n=1 Tax=Thamnidium elegans TaxID=101142 RepID=A0A8H7SEH3_9FUNG|nr:hypothetical protein INT48_001419 [Thamnidium elegans]